MKKYILILVVLGAIGAGVYLFYPQKASQKTIDKMADEICEAVKDIDLNNPEQVMSIASITADITGKQEYQLIEYEEFEAASFKKCERFKEIMDAYNKL